MLRTTTFVLLAICASSVLSVEEDFFGPNQPFSRQSLFELEPDQLTVGSKSIHQKAADSTYEKYFDQNLDQTDSTSKTTFKQRYFVNTQWKGTTNGAVHILYLEGEGIGSASKVTDEKWPHVALAKSLKATAWSLEHRYRGKSQPTKKTITANLQKYLSTSQAIEDIATFIKAQNKNSGETAPKWVVVGRDYGGNLALWFRQKYADLTVGAVSDSAPIIPTINFYSFERFVEEAYSNYSYECWHGVKFAALSIRNEIQYQEGVDRLNDQLKLKPPIDDNKVDYKSFQNLHKNIIRMFEVPVVYNRVNVGPFATSCGIEDVCKIMSNETVKDIQRVYLLANMLMSNVYGSKDKFPGIANSYEQLVKYVAKSEHTDSEVAQPSTRSWLYQQCYEYGQFVTTDNGRGLFYNTVPNDYNIGLCSDAFGEKIYSFTVDTLKSGVVNTTKTFDTSGIYKGTNALIFNGAHDPWSLLGVKSASDSSSTVTNLKDVGHAAVLQPAHVKDPQVLKDARSSISTNVKKWVAATTKKLAAKANNGFKTAHKDHTEQKQIESIAFPEIHNWNAKIEYSADGQPPKTAPSYKHNLHKVGSGELPEQTLFTGKKISFVDHMKINRIRKGIDLKDAVNITMKKHYLNTGYIIQDADHFNSDNNIQFAQRFFKNDQFQRDKDAVRFLMLGAEAAIDYSYVDDDFMQFFRWAKDFKAVLYVIEHRFFGYSAPTANTSVPMLKRFMTTEQVLADAAIFIKNTNAADNNTANPRWVIFGGSYGGNLVATFRLRYPKLSVGGIASSGPLNAKTDFWEYMQKVERDIKNYGPNFCPSAIRRFFGWIRRKVNTRPGRKEIKEAFCISNHWDENYIQEKDVEVLLASRVMQLDGMIQYDSEKHTYLNYMCKYYKAFDDAYDAEKQERAREIDNAFHRVEKHILGKKSKNGKEVALTADDRYDQYDEDDKYDDYDDSVPSRYSDSQEGEPEITCPSNCYRCGRVSYNQMLKSQQDVFRTCFYGQCSDEMRLWFWLSCSQWGYAESNNYGYNYFETALPINYILDLCANVFGDNYNRTGVDAGVKATNLAYGGSDNYNGTNCMFVNGSEDPWSTLSVYKPLQKSTTSLLIDGTSHCVDMYREYDHDVQVLKDARKKIKKQIVRWVRSAKKAKKN